MGTDISSSFDTVHPLFVDPEGRLGEVVAALAALEEPVAPRHVGTVEAAARAVTDHRVDCVVVLDAPETDDGPAVDGVERFEAVAGTVRQVPVVIYSLDCEHGMLHRAVEAGATVVAAPPDRPELIYRQLRNAAGMERHFQSDSDLLESLLGYYPHHLFLKDDAGRFEAMSEATAEQYGFDREELVGLTDYEILDPGTARETYEEEQALLDSGEPAINRVDHYFDRHGRKRWVSITKAPRYDDAGEPVGIVGSSRDVTEEKHHEQMVRELHEASRALVRAETRTDIGEVAMGLTADIPVFSEIQVVLLDDSEAGVRPLNSEHTPDPALFDRYRSAFERAVATGETQHVAADGTALEGASTVEQRRVIVLPLSDHGALGLAADAETLTEFGADLAHILAANVEAAMDRAEREAELERQNERLEEFASIVSHDLRNPLSVASGAAELAADETDSEHVDQVRDALDRMDRLIEALLTLARRGKVVGGTDRVDVGGAARDAWNLVETRGASLVVDSTGVVSADRDRLVELFENLFRNSVEHGSTDGDAADSLTVTVGVREGGDGFYVADDGRGIDAEDRERLFEMGVSRRDAGTGYGLYIVSTIADAHGWTVTAGDSAAGGARFDLAGAAVEPTD